MLSRQIALSARVARQTARFITDVRSEEKRHTRVRARAERYCAEGGAAMNLRHNGRSDQLAFGREGAGVFEAAGTDPRAQAPRSRSCPLRARRRPRSICAAQSRDGRRPGSARVREPAPFRRRDWSAPRRRPRSLAAPASRDASDPLGAVVAAVRADIRHSWTATEIARLGGLSPSQTRRLFQKILRESPRRWLIPERLIAAQSLMIRENVAIANVAEVCGFCDAITSAASSNGSSAHRLLLGVGRNSAQTGLSEGPPIVRIETNVLCVLESCADIQVAACQPP